MTYKTKERKRVVFLNPSKQQQQQQKIERNWLQNKNQLDTIALRSL